MRQSVQGYQKRNSKNDCLEIRHTKYRAPFCTYQKRRIFYICKPYSNKTSLKVPPSKKRHWQYNREKMLPWGWFKRKESIILSNKRYLSANKPSPNLYWVSALILFHLKRAWVWQMVLQQWKKSLCRNYCLPVSVFNQVGNKNMEGEKSTWNLPSLWMGSMGAPSMETTGVLSSCKYQ